MTTQPIASTASTISVALCTYNGAVYLPEQLASIAAQSRLPDELIICDDASTDATPHIARGFAARAAFPVRLLVNSKRLGPTRNFEQAVISCSGDTVVFCDQDDVWLNRKLQVIEETFAHAPGTGAVFSDAALVDEKLLPLGRTLWESAGFGARAQSRFEQGGQVQMLMKCTPALGLTLAFRAAFKSAILPFHANHGHDLWTVLIISALADVSLAKQPLVQYRQHSGQLVGIVGMPNLRHRVTATGRVTGEAHLKTATLYRDVIQRLEQLGAENGRADKMALLREKAAHLQARGLLVQSRWRRLPTVLRELGMLHYHHYSNGLLSAVKDLFLP